jgi:pilus assembly protein TadC
MSFFYNLGEAIIPKKIRIKIKKYVQKSGSYDVPYGIYGIVFLLSIIFSALLYFIFFINIFKTANPIVMALISFLVLCLTEFTLILALGIGMWLYYEFVIFRRTVKIEEVLPDFLEEVSVNLRAGMSFDKALWNSVEPEFGVLDKEIEIVAKKVMSGEDTEKALKDFSDKYNSTLLQECMDLIIIGIKSGGNISDLIDKVVDNVKSASYLKKELIASVMSYIIFISATAVVISPILFALSFNLMEIIQSLGEKLVTTSYSALPINLGYKTINPEDFVLFSKICVVIIAAVSGMIIADLREGSIKAGVKYILIFIPVAYFTYLGMLNLFTSLFGILG